MLSNFSDACHLNDILVDVIRFNVEEMGVYGAKYDVLVCPCLEHRYLAVSGYGNELSQGATCAIRRWMRQSACAGVSVIV